MVWQRTLSSFLYLFVITPAVNLNTYSWQLVQSRDVWVAEIVSCKALYFLRSSLLLERGFLMALGPLCPACGIATMKSTVMIFKEE